MYNIRFDSSAEKFIDKAQRELAKRILDRIEELASDPFPRQATKVLGQTDVYRVRVGKYRILYAVFREKSLIVITDIDNRGRVYE